MTMPRPRSDQPTGLLTESESIFEKYLERNGLSFERVPVASSPRPDYLVMSGAGTLAFEVKELSSDKNFKADSFSVSSRTVGNHIRDKIVKARKQIRFGADRGIPSILVIYNNIDPLQMFGTEEHDFKAAMYGAHTLSIDKSSGKIVNSFQGRNASFTEENRTYFSALARLSTFNSQIRLTLFENIFAAVSIEYDALPACFEIVRFERTSPPAA